MKISAASKKKLADIILENPYRTGKELVDLFNDFREDKDVYGHGFSSRKDYVKCKIDELNGSEKLRMLIEEIFHLSHFDSFLASLKEVTQNFNVFLVKDGYILQIVETDRGIGGKVKHTDSGLIDIKNAPISHEFINEQINKCREKLTLPQPDIDGAITNARSLAESIMEFILKELDVDVPDCKGDLISLYKAVKRQLNLDYHKDMEDTLKQVATGLSSIVAGVAGLSNQLSDRHARKYKPLLFHAKLAINASFTLCDFLLDSLERKKYRLIP
ncbi:abortive infection family protein [Estrella lausannensis]|uniref:Abortive infection protein-like C-terminal domain-containing protein n=1 Tax=Estrella lausannensis TaxID=483423 RepID=A0A0H5DTK7_9BACT|nr:abortive infection family protein [Estrella lausannensis]CRX39194.1 conserved hypothetical protein [Estrella lausannensis]